MWATHDTVRFHVNRQDVDLAVDFIPQDADRLFQEVRLGHDGLAFGCVQDDRGIALGSIGVVFANLGPVPTMDFLLQFAGEQTVGVVRPEALEAWVAGLHDACLYAKTMTNPAWNEIDRGIIDAAVAADTLGLSPLTPLRRLSSAMWDIERRRQSA